jgi:regulator of protease activity HflC (stomatin/prohibitin superfamily)
MENFISLIFQNLLQLLPIVIVKTYERGVRWRWGKSPKELEPGVHLRIWLYHFVDVYAVVDDVIELPIQTVITKDEKLVCFSANIGYRVVDVVKHMNVQDFTEATKGLAMTHLAKRVRSLTLVELVSDLSKLERSLRGTLTNKYSAWGTEVYNVGFTNFAEVPQQIRVFTDGGASSIVPLHNSHHGG